MTSKLTTIKVAFGDDIRRLAVASTTSWAELRSTLAGLFGIDAASIVLAYRDAEGDQITVASDLEWRQLIEQGVSIRLTVALRAPASAHHPQASQPTSLTSESAPQEPPQQQQQQQQQPASFDTMAQDLDSLFQEMHRVWQANPQLSQQGAALAESLSNGLQGVFQEAQRVWEANPQLRQQGEAISKQFADVLASAAASSERDGAQPAAAKGPFCGFSSGAAPPCPWFFAPTASATSAQDDYAEGDKLAKLAAMGFYDAETNRVLLRKHLGNVHRVVEELLT